ncbi:DUF1800 domain-containing protein [Azospirillum canadense]|uniref:DUF1800 domain-containing protein n=1 Tax=Azospirillum canadense TaxID=403962 RepID=UPI002227658E|nr:DUF1800 domain-containing protein [Azospirillum canadense]MCW2240012.1 uncharacterized protein (DUF1800 family) [Azospirillum canadense]
MTLPPPPLPVIALNRLAFGPRPGDAEALQREGLARWLDRQLAPGEPDDAAVERHLADARLRIRYAAAEGWAAMDEERTLASLDKPIEALWPLADNRKPMPGAERQMPRLEVAAATVIRAVHGQRQLREVMADFWHNHFNVNAAGDQTVAAALPVYDREVIRRHALGNFREFLEAVATSTAMLAYLNNRSSRAGIANENYARELFELHGLGRGAYLNALYNRWRDVPGAAKGEPAGYIDQDVYEAARAFTGWTVEDGAGLGGDVRLPATGRFTYVEAWHDNYQKRVLAREFDPFQAPMADGRRVLDLVADHPATARNLCAKLCRRLVCDEPPDALVVLAARVWTENRRKPDQIARVVRAIALSADFARSWGGKVKRPLELVASFARATGTDLTATNGLLGELDGSGQKLFGWPAPNGHPDIMDAWLGAAAMRRRWSLLLGLAENWWKTGAPDPARHFSGPVAAGPAVDHWQRVLFGRDPAPDVTAAILAGMKLGPDATLAPGSRDGDARLRRIAAFVAMAPPFHQR